MGDQPMLQTMSLCPLKWLAVKNLKIPHHAQKCPVVKN